jgi:ubiquinone/menaquinone biosynthesis C-methylase UbiE
MAYNYEQSIWGRGVASLKWSSPTSFRLRQALLAIKDLPSQSSVLEIGCGAGQFIRAIQQQRSELKCYGCDISQEALRIAREDSAENIEYALNEGCTLPYADKSMNAVLIFDVLEHVDEVDLLVSEIRRVLKPGGILYAFVPCEGDWLSWWHWLDRIGLKHDLTKKHAGHINYFSRKELAQVFHKYDFEKKYTRYSEHVLGQAVGITSFTMMDRAVRKQGISQLNNESFFTAQNSSSLVQKIKSSVNSLIFLESYLFSRIPSPNTHVVVTVKDFNI